MFGHNNNDQIAQDQQNDAHVALGDDTINDLTSGAPAPYLNDQPAGAPPVQASSPADASFVQPAAGPIVQPPAPTQDNSFPEPSNELSEEPTAATQNTPADPVAPTEAHDELLSLKQEALTSLSPLVHNLELDTEEKFKTLMMLIQASDNHELVKEAYEAAQAIPDEKVRAQALLDVVNEINYFTHGKDEDTKS